MRGLVVSLFFVIAIAAVFAWSASLRRGGSSAGDAMLVRPVYWSVVDGRDSDIIPARRDYGDDYCRALQHRYGGFLDGDRSVVKVESISVDVAKRCKDKVEHLIANELTDVEKKLFADRVGQCFSLRLFDESIIHVVLIVPSHLVQHVEDRPILMTDGVMIELYLDENYRIVHEEKSYQRHLLESSSETVCADKQSALQPNSARRAKAFEFVA